MIRPALRTCALLVVFALVCPAILAPASVQDARPAPTAPGAKDKCPVCGMFVAKFAGFLAEIVFKDGSYAFFDGPKDMFRYYLDLKTYNPAKTQADVARLSVTDYYSMTFIDGKNAYYVVGSDVLGPMGNELIPTARETDARTFAKDHKGKRILKFSEVTRDMLKTMD